MKRALLVAVAACRGPAPPRVIQVTTTLPGASAEDVARRISNPLERHFLVEVGNVKSVTSVSRAGRSEISVAVERDDLDTTFVAVQAAVRTAARSLPTNTPVLPMVRVPGDLVGRYVLDDAALAARIQRIAGVGGVTVCAGTACRAIGAGSVVIEVATMGPEIDASAVRAGIEAATGLVPFAPAHRILVTLRADEDRATALRDAVAAVPEIGPFLVMQRPGEPVAIFVGDERADAVAMALSSLPFVRRAARAEVLVELSGPEADLARAVPGITADLERRGALATTVGLDRGTEIIHVDTQPAIRLYTRDETLPDVPAAIHVARRAP